MASRKTTQGKPVLDTKGGVPDQKFQLRLFRGEVDGRPDYHLQVHRDAEGDHDDDGYEGLARRRLVEVLDIIISDTDEECQAAAAVKALQHVGDGMQFLLETLVRRVFDYAYELGKKDGLEESRQGVLEQK